MKSLADVCKVFDKIDYFAEAYAVRLNKTKFKMIFGKGVIKETPVVFAKPLTYMNLSGGAIQQTASFFRIPVERIVVVHDDLDLHFGTIKIGSSSGDGGHKGIRSTIEALGSKLFMRVRLGIGRPQDRMEVVEWVLTRFNSCEEKSLESILNETQKALEVLLQQGLQKTMTLFNGKCLVP